MENLIKKVKFFILNQTAQKKGKKNQQADQSEKKEGKLLLILKINHSHRNQFQSI